MRHSVIEGFLFDIKTFKNSPDVIIFLINEKGKVLGPFLDSFYPPVYIKIKDFNSKIKESLNNLVNLGIIKSWIKTRKLDLFRDKFIDVFELHTITYEDIFHHVRKEMEHVTFYNTEINKSNYYLISKNLTPTQKLRIQINSENQILFIEPQPCSLQNTLDLLRKVEMFVRNNHLILDLTGRAEEMNFTNPLEAAERIRKIFKDWDPHLVLTSGGDSYILRILRNIERLYGLPLYLDKEYTHKHRFNLQMKKTGKSYFSYGRFYFMPNPIYLVGRWHIDKDNSFFFQESNLEGILEISKLTKIPVDTTSRITIGTAMTALQYNIAFQENILIPSRKAQSEEFRTIESLLVGDKGGLLFLPRPGLYRNIIEIDFSQMYPTIMVKYNISPETIRRKGKGIRVPETRYVIETKRKGIIPKSLEKLLELREQYKNLYLSTKDEKFLNREKAIKWVLVTCFGYLGYRNARFGKIEAHEAVTSFGREILLRAKEISENMGYKIIHAMTDSLWLSGDTEISKIEQLLDKITKETGIKIKLENIYHWILFAKSKQRPKISAPTRYVGLSLGGELKVRGFMLRRHDTPPWIKKFQQELLNILKIHGINEKSKKLLINNFNLEMEKLNLGKIKPEDLLITKRVSKRIDKFKVNTDVLKVLLKLKEKNIRVEIGEKVGFLYTDFGPEPFFDLNSFYPIDSEKYIQLLERAFNEIMEVFDY